MSRGLDEAIRRWREVARAIVTSTSSTPSQRQLAWAFLKRHGAA